MRLMREIDPVGVRERKSRRLVRRQYTSKVSRIIWNTIPFCYFLKSI